MINKIRYIKDLLWFLVFWGIVSAIFRMWFGLGETTNLTDEMPWGLWKVFNMIAGVALSTCGFSLGFFVYVLKIERFKPLVKPAILIAFLGYGSSCLALLFDIGLPQRFWHPFLMWNEHSFLFEVFWCVILYFTVTLIELSPNILEKFKSEKLVNFLHKIATGVVIIGISLSSLHHSSLGSLFLTTPFRLHELWYTSLIPWMFLSSAVGGGMMFLILIKIIYSKFYDPNSIYGNNYIKSKNVCSLDGMYLKNSPKEYGKEIPMLSSLAVISSFVLGFYLLLKIYNLFNNGSIDALLSGTWESWLFSFELVLSTLIPIVLVIIKRTRNSPYGLGIAAFSASNGLVLNRMNVGIFGFFRDSGFVYFPSLIEWTLSIGILAAAALALIYISENFTIFNKFWEQKKIEKGLFSASFDSFSRVWTSALNDGLYKISIIAVFTLPIAFVFQFPNFKKNDKTEQIISAKGIDLNRSILLINGNSNDISTEFPHEDHKKQLGAESSCNRCHHISMPKDHSTPCAKCHRNMFENTNIFSHSNHTNYISKLNNIGGLHPSNNSCSFCHTPKTAKKSLNAKKCAECHLKDMKLENNIIKIKNIQYANSYLDDMNKN